MKKIKVAAALFLSVIVILSCFSVPAQTGDTNSVPTAETAPLIKAAKKTKSSGKWILRKRGYSYKKNGKYLRGIHKIGKRYYYFDEDGIQHTGWQKIGKYYYYFRIKKGKKGYMLRNDKYNGITLRKRGRAKVGSHKAKLKLLCKATKIVEKATKPDMDRRKKLRVCFDYVIQNYKYRGDPKFYYSSDWEIVYAKRMMEQYHGSCYEYGALFAFVANACGFKYSYAVSSGGHGWTRVGKYIYDPSWEQVDIAHSYFRLDPSLSGKDGRPNYTKHEKYVKRI